MPLLRFPGDARPPDGAVRGASASLHRPNPGTVEVSFLLLASARTGLSRPPSLAPPDGVAVVDGGNTWIAPGMAAAPVSPIDALVLPPVATEEDGQPPPRVTGLWEHLCVELFVAAAPAAAGADAAAPCDAPTTGECATAQAGTAADAPYWEVNVAPGSGAWNVFRFDGYRAGMAPEDRLPAPVAASTAVGLAPIGTASDAASMQLTVNVTLPLPPALAAASELRVGASALMVEASLPQVDAGAPVEPRTAFWALHHAAPRPDFHHADSLVARLRTKS